MTSATNWTHDLSPYLQARYNKLLRDFREEVQRLKEEHIQGHGRMERREYKRRYAWVTKHFPGQKVTRELLADAPRREKEFAERERGAWSPSQDLLNQAPASPDEWGQWIVGLNLGAKAGTGIWKARFHAIMTALSAQDKNGSRKPTPSARKPVYGKDMDRDDDPDGERY